VKVLIAAHNVRSGGGISVALNIISSLVEQAPEYEFLVSVPAGVGYENVLEDYRNCEVIILRQGAGIAARAYFEAYLLPRKASSFGAEIALCLGNMGVLRMKIQQAILFHNAYYVYPSEHFGRSATLKMRAMLVLQKFAFKRDLARTKMLMCQTEVMADRVRALYGYSGRIIIVPNRVSRFVLGKSKADASLRAQLDLLPDGKHLLLCLAAYYTHKNLEVLIDLFSQYPIQLKDYAAIITIAPESSPGARKLLLEIEKRGVGTSIINIGPVKQEHLSSVYEKSYALIMPTLLESFSGAYLEAMHYGLPIITSKFDFSESVCGNAAEYFNPWDLKSIVDAITALQYRRNELIQEAHARFAAIVDDWETTGSRLKSEIEELVGWQTDG
jgi:glycosyltransferase involved in cell wall biosynthesis